MISNLMIQPHFLASNTLATLGKAKRWFKLYPGPKLLQSSHGILGCTQQACVVRDTSQVSSVKETNFNF